MDKHYNFKEIEDKWYHYWLDNKLFESNPDDAKKPYCILQPPANISGNLHLGHALNNTFQDILIRFHKLNGFNTLWIPGTDHGGLGTINAFKKELLKQHINYNELNPEELKNKLNDWSIKNKNNIINQIKKLGCACDWSREQFTMNDNFSELVQKTFIKLYNNSLIYKGKYIVNWCPKCSTAISDDEVNHTESEGILYYLKYKFVKNDDYVVIATTRPETIFGDVAIAFNPLDDRYLKFENEELFVPVINKKIKMIKDNNISKDFGTGLVKITPAHDKLDYYIGKNHNLETIQIINEKCKIQNTNTNYDGLDRFKCREEIVKELIKGEFIEKKENYKNKIGKCYRCQTIIEPFLSDQWFLKMESLIDLAQNAINNEEIELIPKFQTKNFNVWMNKNIDWCISRQISFGHTLPIWYCNNCSEIICQIQKPSICMNCKCDVLIQDSNVLDTWFSSSLWAFGVFDNKKDFECYFPTATLITGKDILYFWVTRMIMMSLHFTKQIPFKKVLLHGIIRDENNNKMSKSIGNVIDPLSIIDKYGTDALRYSLTINLPTTLRVFASKVMQALQI